MTPVKRDSMFMGAVPARPLGEHEAAVPPIGWVQMPIWMDGGHIDECGTMLAYLIWRYGAWGLQDAIARFFETHEPNASGMPCSCADCARYAEALNNLITWPPLRKVNSSDPSLA